LITAKPWRELPLTLENWLPQRNGFCPFAEVSHMAELSLTWGISKRDAHCLITAARNSWRIVRHPEVAEKSLESHPEYLARLGRWGS